MFSKLFVEDLTVDKPRFRLTQELIFSPASSAAPIVVPADFITDFASIPQFLWAVLPPVGAYDRAAVIHDWLYRRGEQTRLASDRILLSGMVDLGVGLVKRQLIYRGVRLFGDLVWTRYRSGDSKETR